VGYALVFVIGVLLSATLANNFRLPELEKQAQIKNKIRLA